jgi:hypothetical protein
MFTAKGYTESLDKLASWNRTNWFDVDHENEMMLVDSFKSIPFLDLVHCLFGREERLFTITTSLLSNQSVRYPLLGPSLLSFQGSSINRNVLSCNEARFNQI